jgi:phosphatidylserine synthase
MHIYLVQEYEFTWVGRIGLPLLLLVVGVLMVSRIRYAHLVYELTKGQRSFPFFIGLIFSVFLVVIRHEFMLPLLFTAYIMSGIVGVAVGRLLDRMDVAEDHESVVR